MNRQRLAGVAVVLFASGLILHARQTGAQRNVLMKHDISGFPGHEGVVVQVELASGAREPKHTHPGDLFGYVKEGSLTLGIEGQEPVTLQSGQVFFVPAGKVHWGENSGATSAKMVSTFVVEKGQPLTSPVK